MENDTITKRLHDLREEFSAGQGQLSHLNKQINQLEKTLLRISGAIQILEEMHETDTVEAR